MNQIHKEFEKNYKKLEDKKRKIIALKTQLENDFEITINEPFNHLLNKKVEVLYISGMEDTYDQELKTISYWSGYRVVNGQAIPVFFKPNPDGTKSLQRDYFGVKEIISMYEIN